MGTQRLTPPSRNARQSNPLLIPLAVVGGLMGIFAGYGVLAVIRDHGFNLKPPAESAEGKAVARKSVAAPKSNPKQPVINQTTKAQRQEVVVSPKAETNHSAQSAIDANRLVTSEPTRRTRTTRASDASLKIAVNDTSTPPLPPPDEPSHEISAEASADADPSLPPPSSLLEQSSHGSANATAAIVPLTLKQDVIRVIAIPEEVPAESLLCDIGFSPELTGRQLPTGAYEIVAERLGKRGELRQELPLHISGVGAAIEINIRQQNKAAICEIRPKFSLPMSGIKQLTIASGSLLQNSLNRTHNNTIAAEQSLPNMHSKLDDLSRQLADAQRATNGVGNNPADTGLIHHNATMKINQLNRAIPVLKKDIARAEQLIANKYALETDIDDLNQISQYAERIASSATISVRFYNGDVTIPATVK